MRRARTAVLVLLLLSCSTRPGADRARLDESVGRASAGGVSFVVADGLAAVREAAAGRLELWASAPALDVALTIESGATRAWEIVVRNVLFDAELSGTADGAPLAITAAARTRPTRGAWTFTLPAGATAARLRLAGPDAEAPGEFAIAIFADVQNAIDRVGDLFARMNEDPTLRFVLASGDLTASGAREELLEFQSRLEGLGIPMFATIGNHELFADQFPWHELFGRSSVHFAHRGVRFTLADSGEGTLDPAVASWADAKLEAARDAVHLFATHIPLFDPVGPRDGGFASRTEAAALLRRLSDTKVDATFYGHVHSYYAFSNAGIPAYITGGGGALPERLDGVQRHYLRVRLDGAKGVRDVALVRVD